MTKNMIAAGALGFALAASPMLALANTDTGSVHANVNANVKASVADETAVSVVISDNGSALVRGAKVTDVSNGAITAETTVNDASMTWTIDTDSDTEYVDVGGSALSRGDIEEGDYVSFSGSVESSFTSVDADTVRDWSEGSGPVTGKHWWQPITKWPIINFFAHGKADVNAH